MLSRTLIFSALLTAACAEPYAPFEQAEPEAPWSDEGTEPNSPSEHEDVGDTVDAFDLAAEAWDVPADLLIAVSAANTGHQMVVGEVEFEGQVPLMGVMGIPDSMVDTAADLAGLEADAVVHEYDANIQAAAALLDHWADEEGIDRGDMGAWAPLVARFSGIEDTNIQAFYVHSEVYAALQAGVALEGVDIQPRKVTPDFPEPVENLYATADRSYAVWRPSPNNSARPSGSAGDPAMIVIHTCEGTYSGCWGWLTNGSSGVSAHYVVNGTGSEVSQLVKENRKAWHIGATYQCSRNGSVDCWRNGSGSNNFTVGIEHAGYASQTSWNSGLIDKSAQLSCDITKSHSMPRDAYHVVAHGTLQPYNRTDPGAAWPWSSYLSKIRSKCGDGGGGGGGGTPTGTRVIDSNNAKNDTANQYVEVSGNWTSSASVSGYYGTGYWWRSTGSTSDAANFWFKNSAKSCYKVQAWWAAASDRSPTAPFVMIDKDGTVVDKVYKDQRSNGGKWNTLGTYAFPSGWNRVALSRWTTAGDVVIADAVRLVPDTSCPGMVDITVDSANANNGSDAKVEFSSNWTSSTSTSGYYGSDYVYAAASPVSDTFKYWFYLDSASKVKIDARWTAGSNRSASAPFLIRDPDGTIVARSNQDQRTNNNTWVGLGTVTLPAGWNRVELSRWTSASGVVVADAVRVKSAP